MRMVGLPMVVVMVMVLLLAWAVHGDGARKRERGGEIKKRNRAMQGCTHSARGDVSRYWLYFLFVVDKRLCVYNV